MRAGRLRFRWIELQLLILPALLLVVGFLSVTIANRRVVDSLTIAEIRPAVLVAGALLVMSLLFGLLGVRGDQTLLPITAVLAALGVILVDRIRTALGPGSTFYASISDPGISPDYPQMGDGLRQMLILQAELESHRRQGWVEMAG